MRDIGVAKKKEMGESAVTKLQGSYFDNKNNMLKIDWQDDEILFSYAHNPKVLQYVRNIIGENVYSIHSMYINKVRKLMIILFLAS